MLSSPPVLLLDIMSTVVYDPFLVELPGFFDMSFQELIHDKDPDAWPTFERGEIDEPTFWRTFFKDRREVDVQGIRRALEAAYAMLPGMEALLQELHDAHVPMHALSNYPVWWEMIEHKLSLSRFMTWDFVSCKMGVRKPDPLIYTRAAQALDAPPSGCIFVDDRAKNCDGARAVGMSAIEFHSAAQLRRDLLAMAPDLLG